MASAPNGTALGNADAIRRGEMNNISDGTTEMEMSPVTILPHEVIEKLAELDLELSEGLYLFIKMRVTEIMLCYLAVTNN